MKYLQKLGEALMLPVAVLPLCGILMGIGYAMCPYAMQGGEITGSIPMIGNFFIHAGGAIIDNIPILFAVGVGIGMSKDNHGVSALAALVSWLLLTNLLSSDYVCSAAPYVKYNKEWFMAFKNIQNPFIGILSGIIGSACYNKFKDVKLPDVLSFFSETRCVAIVAGLFTIIAIVFLAFLWPVCFAGLMSFGKLIAKMGAVGASIYAVLNCLLQGVGMQQALNNIFWFDTIGIGDLSNFWAGKTSADVGWDLGMYMSGFFPCMIFGIPGAALAMYFCVDKAKRAKVGGILFSAAICAAVCGVTEPFEFAFMYISPGLYLIYSLLYGVFTYLTLLSGFRAGFTFSAGIIDLVFSSSLPAADRIWVIIPLGLFTAAIFYVVFRYAIPKWNLKTPGREDDEESD